MTTLPLLLILVLVFVCSFSPSTRREQGYHHISTEVYYPETYAGESSLKVCDGSGEDKTCADQHLLDLDVADHLNYLGYPLTSADC